MKYFKNIIELVGRTPLVRMNRLSSGRNLMLAKLEYFNPLGSIKDRVAVSMIEEAERKGILKKGSTIVEPTSGNTGIALAFVCAVKGYRLMLTMPENMSEERIEILRILGAEVVLTPAELGMKGAIDKASEIVEMLNAYMPNQFTNPANVHAHERTTAEEIWEDTEGKVDILIAGVGTGGTITGVGKYLKKRKKDVMIVAVEPKESPVMSGGKPGRHGIQGIGAGFVPEIMDLRIVDEIIRVETSDAVNEVKELARLEGIFVGISSGAVMFAGKMVDREVEGKNIVMVFPDGGFKYLSVL